MSLLDISLLGIRQHLVEINFTFADQEKSSKFLIWTIKHLEAVQRKSSILEDLTLFQKNRWSQCIDGLLTEAATFALFRSL